MSFKGKKLGNKGFTLIESLFALILVAILMGILVMITTLSKDYYKDSESHSEGQMLASSLTNAIQDELRYATGVTEETEEPVNIIFYDISEEDGSKTSNSYKARHFTYYSNSDIDKKNINAIGYGVRCSIISDKSGADNPYKIYVQTLSGAKYPLVGNGSYVHNLEAFADVYFVEDVKRFYVTLVVYDNKKVTHSSIVSKYQSQEYYNNKDITSGGEYTYKDLPGVISRTSFIVNPLNENTIY